MPAEVYYIIIIITGLSVAGFIIAGLFVSTGALALSPWHLARIEQPHESSRAIGETPAMEAAAELIARAQLICGERHVLTDPIVLSAYRSDGTRRDGPLPLAAILPGTVPEVVNVVAACAATHIRYVVRGAGTSRSGGALPVAGGVLIVLSRMRGIIRATGRELTVEAGVPLSALPRPAAGSWLTPAAHGRERPELVGTVGGFLGETPGVGNISALELVRPDGRHVKLDSCSPGYDVAGAFPGSRGRAGIAVSITLRAMPL